MKRLSGALVVFFSLLLASCGGGSGNILTDVPVAAVPAGQHAQKTLGAGGGDVVLASSDGAAFTLSIPAGALALNTVIGITTVSTASGQRFNLQLLPAGLVLARGKTATLTISLPPGTALPATGALVYDGVPIAFSRQGDGSLQAQISNFAQSSGATAALAALRNNPVAGPVVRILAGGGSAPCGGIPQLAGTDGTLSASDAVDIDIYGQCMVNAVRALAANAQYGAAVRLASATAAYLQRLGVGNDAGFVRQASDIACIAYKDALNTALVTPVTTMGTLYAVLKPVLFWEGVRQGFGASCPGIAETDFINITNAKTNEAAAFYASKKGAIVDTTGVEYTEAAQEAKAGHDTIVQVRSLQPAPALANVVTVAIEQRAQPSLLDAILQPPWQRCRDSGDYTELLHLWELMDAPQPVKDAIQYCATQIGAQARDANNAVSAVLSPGLGGIRVDLRNTRGTLAVNRDSKIQLSGSIGALACPASDTEQLQVSFEGVEVATLASSGSVLLGGDRTLPALKASDLLRAAGLRDDDSGTHALAIKRRNSTCAAALGIADEVLATVALDFGARPLKVVVTFASAAANVPYTNATDSDIVRATELSLPFHHVVDMPARNYRSDLSLKLDDPNTLVWSGTLDSNDQPSGFAMYSIEGTVTFPKSGTATLTLNPAWIVTTRDCVPVPGSTDQTQISPVFLATDFAGYLSGPSARQPAGVILYTCDVGPGGVPIPTVLTASVHVEADAPLAFQFYVRHLTGHLIGNGTIMTLHFEPDH